MASSRYHLRVAQLGYGDVLRDGASAFGNHLRGVGVVGGAYSIDLGSRERFDTVNPLGDDIRSGG